MTASKVENAKTSYNARLRKRKLRRKGKRLASKGKQFSGGWNLSAGRIGRMP